MTGPAGARHLGLNNTPWHDGRLTAMLDWDCADVGPAGMDLGSLRCDAAWCHSVEAAEHVLGGCGAEVPGPAVDGLPAGHGWLPISMACRAALTRKSMSERRDAFLAAALSQLTAVGWHVTRWAMHKFTRFQGKYAKAMAWLQKIYQYKPGLFAHWQLVAFTAPHAGLWGPDDGRLSRPVLRAAGGVPMFFVKRVMARVTAHRVAWGV